MEPLRTDLILGDCLQQMAALPDSSIDMILADLPYGCTRNPWDSVVDIPAMWDQFSRLCTGAIVLTATQPFTSRLVSSNLREFRYSLVWLKTIATGHLDANRRPLRKHEDILVFWRERPPYNPQMSFGHKPYKVVRQADSHVSSNYNHKTEPGSFTVSDGTRYPTTVMEFKHERGLHPTQKPVPLLENLIRTYTHPGGTILDPTMGSGSTGVACLRTGRNFFGIEQDPETYLLAWERMRRASGVPVL